MRKKNHREFGAFNGMSMKIDYEEGAHTSHRPPKCATDKSAHLIARGWSQFQFRRKPVSLFTANTLRSIRKQQPKQEHQTTKNERSAMNEPNFKIKNKLKHNANTSV